jgi:hypothetical protein
MRWPLHAPNAGCESAVALLKPRRAFCGWGYLQLWPGAELPIQENPDSYFLYRVLQGSVTLLYGNGRTRPHRVDVGPGDLFDVCPLNFFGMRNASGGEWATLCYMRSQQEVAAEPRGAVAEAGDGLDEEESPPKRRKRHRDADTPFGP